MNRILPDQLQQLFMVSSTDDLPENASLPYDTGYGLSSVGLYQSGLPAKKSSQSTNHDLLSRKDLINCPSQHKVTSFVWWLITVT